MGSFNVNLKGRGIRGESYADIARRSGLFGILPTDDDETVIGKINADAAASAALAESAAGPTYPDTAAGLADTVDGQAFAVDNGDGTVTIYLNDNGSAVAQRTLATTAALASSSGAGMVGSGNGQSIETRLANSEVNIGDYWVAGDPDWTNAFERAIYTAFPDRDYVSIYVPPGVYVLSRQIIPRRTVTIRGGGNATTFLRFTNVSSINPTLRGAFSFGLETTLAAYTTNPNNYPVRPNTIVAGGADQSQLHDLSIEITGTRPAGFDYGIFNSARLTTNNVLVYGAGIANIAGTLIIDSGNTLIGNTNGSVFRNTRSLFATEYAWVADGSDANAITFDHCEAFVPELIGFYDGSQFGNLYTGCRREGVTANTTHGYKTYNPGATNESAFVSCYNEDDAVLDHHWEIENPGLIIGATGAAVDIIAGKNTEFGSANLAGLYTRGQFNFTSSGHPYDLGSSSIPASRAGPEGFKVRGGDGSVYSMERVGDGVSILKDGGTFLKFAAGAAIADVTGGTTVDAECRAAVNAILARLRAGTPVIAT